MRPFFPHPESVGQRYLYARSVRAIIAIIENNKVFQLLELAARDPEARGELDGALLAPFWQDLFMGWEHHFQAHRLRYQPEAIPDGRSWFKIFAGIQCFSRAMELRRASEEEGCREWLERGTFYGDFLCMERLCFLHLEHCERGYGHAAILDDFSEALNIATQAAELHYSLGYGLLATVWWQLGNYFHDLCPCPTGASKINFLKQRFSLFCDDPLMSKSYISARHFCYRETIRSISASVIMQPFCNSILLNASEDVWWWFQLTGGEDFTAASDFFVAALSEKAPALLAEIPTMQYEGMLYVREAFRKVDIEIFETPPVGMSLGARACV